MYIQIKKINIFLKNFLIYYLNKINLFYIKYNYYNKFNTIYCYIYKNKFFIYIKEKNFILLTNIKIYNINNINKFFLIKNINYLIKILIFNKNKYNVYFRNKYIIFIDYSSYYKLKIYKLNFIIKFNNFINIEKDIIINNKIFIKILKTLFLNLNNKNILLKENNFFIKIYNNIVYLISTDYNYYFLYYKLKINNKNYNNNLYKISKKSLLIYLNIFRNYNNDISIYIYNNKYLYINTKKTYYILKIKVIKKIYKFDNLIKIKIKNFYSLIIDNKRILNILIKIYNIINKNNIINIINFKIYKKVIIILYKNKFIYIKKKINKFIYKGRNIKLKINLFLFIKLLLVLNNKYIYINKKNILIKKEIKKNIFFMGFITNIK
ncbi:MAG: hypothetical protein NHF92_00995 [Candidatus Shikimatogenerans bostrichidophilus]|nr:MAG: hypothetical protein NHF92_00995 [Candidatus Shikimatogenerans bostrichidophilus]